ncbi:GRIP and coiled-coil domain-containing protein 2 [Spea bombifrons]|uniref:GRIP and coiled-coil domain-containing protein 2 n=1 Tax=Spea bombifrons TaxID=233779 RepID=UPI00234BDBFC|nr:GRIP and coiled-coil domain-containing protein 2 [Spea bombifrons]
MEDTGQDGISSPATPGASKSKLDTLPKEDLIKFAKKQMVVIQKVKGRCSDLEKEIETLKSRPAVEGTDDVVQALTEKLNSVLLEKAEAQQQLVVLKKEFAKAKHDAENAAKKATELQEHLEESRNSFSKQIESLKYELTQSQCKQKEEVDLLKEELQNALEKQISLSDALHEHESQGVEIKDLKEQIQNTQTAYEEQIASLHKTLETVTKEKNQEIGKLKDANTSCSEKYSNEVQSLHAELVKQRALHQEEVTNLMNQLEAAATLYESAQQKMQDLCNQHVEKEKMLMKEVEATKEKYDQEIRLFKEKPEENSSTCVNAPSEGDKVALLEGILNGLESQHAILKDELTYTNNVKIKLEMEVQHLKSEYFHEREELEFKINELQLAIEDYNSLIEKLKSQLQVTEKDYERLRAQHEEGIHAMREQHKKEIAEMKQAITSVFENERLAFVNEIKVLKEQCDKLQQEKEEAVSNYESIRETLVTFQTELGESAGKISKEFKALKAQQATDVHELQQKLRTAYNNKNDLMETVNRLQAESELLLAKQSECEELQLKVSHLQQKNEEVMTSLYQKEEMLKDMESKVSQTTLQNTEIDSSIKLSSEEIHKLQDTCKSEQEKNLALQQEVEKQAQHNMQLKQTVDELTEQLQEYVRSKDQRQCEIECLQQKLEVLILEKEKMVLELLDVCKIEQELKDQAKHNAQLKQNVDELTEQLQEYVRSKEHSQCEIESLQQKLEVLTLDKEKMEVKSQNDLTSMKSEQDRNLALQQEVENQAKCNALLKQTVNELTEQLQDYVHNKDQHQHEIERLQQQLEALILDKELMEAKSQKGHDELLSLHEEKNTLRGELDKVVAEHEGLREELKELKNRCQLLTEDKEEMTKLLESEKSRMEAMKLQILVLTQTLSIEITEQDLVPMLQAVNAAVHQLNETKQQLVSQVNEKSVQLEESESQCTELRDLLSDYSKEKVLLKEELEETLADKEALQRDLLEMKNALERAKLENQDLLLHIGKISADLENIEKQSKTETILESGHEDRESSAERESGIQTLEAELASVKDLLSKSKDLELQQQSCISELQNKIEIMEKESKEKEEKSNKIKAVAVKAKKELDANKKEVQSAREELEKLKAERDQMTSAMNDLVKAAEGYQNLLREYDRQAEQLETEKGRADNAEHQVEGLCRQLSAASLEQERLTSVNEDFTARVETLQSNTKMLEAQILEMQRAKAAVDKELEAERLVKEQKIKDHCGALKQIEDLQTQLQKEKKLLQKTMQELELVRKDAQQSTLMNMEIEDYERLVKDLNQKIANKSSQLEDLEQEVHIQKQKQTTLQEEISSLQTILQQHEERNTKMKQLLVKTKKELADSKQAESDQLIIQASLKGELEASQQQVEAYKIQVAELMSEKHKVQEQLRALSEQHQRATNTYQQKLSALQEECTAAKAEQATVTAEFESYKVRVHNVLKQQKNKSASQAEQEVFKQEREHLQSMLDQIKVKLQETQHTLQINTVELQALQSEHDVLLERHNKMLQETVTKEAELREKLSAAQSENMVLKTEHAQTVSQLSSQIETQRSNFRDQVRHMQEDHRRTVETLQQQLSKVEAQLFQIKSESTVANPTGSQQSKGLRERRTNDLPLQDLYSLAREEGEGMETTDTESVSSASTHVASLEQLLNSSEARPDKVIETPLWQPEFSKEELAQMLNTTSKSVDHLSGLLHETEATNAILMEQITLLKNEIRRLERNQEREKSVANLEYLKNVLLQFIFLKAGSERQRLLPVIDTMLQLSPEEKGKLFAIAQGEEESAARPAGWASYLHSWSGLR